MSELVKDVLEIITVFSAKLDSQWYLMTSVELPDIPTISHRKNGTIRIDLNVNSIA